MDEINDTIRKFGYSDTLLGNYRHWVVLLRSAQVTLGMLVLAFKGDAQASPAFRPRPTLGCLR